MWPVCIPASELGVGKYAKQKLHVNARFPRARNNKVACRFEVMDRRYVRSAVDRTADLFLDPLRVAISIHLTVRILSQLQYSAKQDSM